MSVRNDNRPYLDLEDADRFLDAKILAEAYHREAVLYRREARKATLEGDEAKAKELWDKAHEKLQQAQKIIDEVI